MRMAGKAASASPGQRDPFQVDESRALPADQQFSWTLNSTKVIVNQPVEFIVTSKDTTHGFGVYSPSGTLLMQEQVMPGFENDFTYTFSETGVYTIRCLEYCGFGHPTMVTSFTVVTG